MARLLLVDDDPDILRLYQTALGRTHDVRAELGGRAGLDALRRDRYDLLLLDLHMPQVDGLAILAELAGRDHLNHDTPVLVVSADTTDETRMRAVRTRGVFLLSKPVPLAVLTRMVASTLERSSAAPPPGPPKRSSMPSAPAFEELVPPAPKKPTT